MTDQEFLSQNLDILYQNISYSTLAKDLIFFTNSSGFGDLAFFLFVILTPLSFCFLAVSLALEEWDGDHSINGKTKIPKNIYTLFQNIFGGIFGLGITILMICIGVQLAFDAAFSSRYIKFNELDELPILKDGNDEQRNYFKKLAANYVVNAEKNYSNQSEFNYIVERGPNLKDVTDWLIQTINDKPYEKQEIADEKLKLINDL